MFDEVFFQMVKHRGIRYYYHSNSRVPHWRIFTPSTKAEFVARSGLDLCNTLAQLISTKFEF